MTGAVSELIIVGIPGTAMVIYNREAENLHPRKLTQRLNLRSGNCALFDRLGLALQGRGPDAMVLACFIIWQPSAPVRSVVVNI